MILLTATTDKIQVISSSAANLDVHISYQEVSSTTFTVTGMGRTNTAISSAATTDVLAAPAGSTNRNVKTIHIRNKHASLANDVTVQFNQNATLFELHKVTLNAGDALEYVEGVGFFTLTTAAALDRRLVVTTDVINATTSFADITGLTCALLSGKNYNFECYLFHQTNATTTGAQFGVNIGAAPTSLILQGWSQLTVSPTVAITLVGEAAVTARDTATAVETTGPGAVNMLHIMYGWIVPSANGTFAIRSKSEVAVASGLTIKAGSWCRIWEATG